MSKLIVLMSDNPACIEGFSKSCKRSKEGATLHLLPKKAKTVTDDEYAHIQKSRPDVFEHLRKLADKPEPKSEEEAKAETEAKAKEEKPKAQDSETSTPKEEDSKGLFKKKRK